MSIARFRVAFPSPVDGAREATVEIDREIGLFTVRPLRRRRRYELPLWWVAETTIWKVVRADLAEKKREKAAARKARRKG